MITELEPPSDRPEPPRRRAWLVGGAIALVVAFGVALVAVTRDDDGGPRAGQQEDTSTTASSAPASQSELEQVVGEISGVVEEERGLDFREPVDVELAEDDEFEARLFEDFEEDAAELEQFEVMYKALGLIAPDGDLAGELREALSVGVVGFYDPETKELVVRGTTLTPFVRVTVAHELTHALDDQHFDLDRPEYDDADDEISFGFTALAEGVATQVEDAYLASLDEAEQEQYYDELGQVSGGSLPDVSLVLLELIIAPYEVGPDFVEALLDEGGQDRLDATYDLPPRTSEQVLDPDRYFDGESAVPLRHPVADGEVVEEGVVGQLMMELLLGEDLDNDEVDEATEGWGGDWAVGWRNGERSCIRLAMVGDTAEDSDQLADAWSTWAEDHDGEGLEVTVDQSGSGEPTTLTSCTA